MTLLRPLKWLAGVFSMLLRLAVLLLAVFDWNWLRGPIERMVLEKTGRAVALGMVNPLLMLIPLVDAGPGQDSDCRQLILIRCVRPAWRDSVAVRAILVYPAQSLCVQCPRPNFL